MEELFFSCFLFLRGEVISLRERSIRADNAARSWLSAKCGSGDPQQKARGKRKRDFEAK